VATSPRRVVALASPRGAGDRTPPSPLGTKKQAPPPPPERAGFSMEAADFPALGPSPAVAERALRKGG
jgi:hypothetical protein